jgi:HMG (high mobility group) box
MAVKRFRSSYIFFVTENFEKFAAASRNARTGRRRSSRYIMRDLGRCWRRMTAAEKCKFKDLAHKDKLRWMREMREKAIKRSSCLSCIALRQQPPPSNVVVPTAGEQVPAAV